MTVIMWQIEEIGLMEKAFKGGPWSTQREVRVFK
jgi:hypothetical protein